jgi:hypothetical protein
MAWAGWASVGAALVVVGVVLGAALSSSSAPDSASSGQTSSSVAQPPAPPVAPNTVCGTSPVPAHGPYLCMLNQSKGTANAAWLVQGRRFPPGTSVTIALTWNSPPQFAPNQTFHHTAQVEPVVAPDGTLRLNINQLFPGSLRLGQFIVEVIGPGDSAANTVFIVIPAGA